MTYGAILISSPRLDTMCKREVEIVNSGAQLPFVTGIAGRFLVTLRAIHPVEPRIPAMLFIHKPW